MIKIIDNAILDGLSQQASQSLRLRKNLNYHTELSDPINRMLNAFEPGTYTAPHCHRSPEKREVFIVLRGKVALFEYSDDGEIVHCHIISPEMGVYAGEVPPGVFHNVVSLQTGTVVYEIKDGPYVPETDKQFALWAPNEGDEKSIEYLQKLINYINELQ